jgi:hypothetical protein
MNDLLQTLIEGDQISIPQLTPDEWEIVRLREPDFWHGLDSWTDEEEHARRVELWHVAKYGETGDAPRWPLLPGFSQNDMRELPEHPDKEVGWIRKQALEALGPRGQGKAAIMLDDARRDHAADRHWWYLHPWCADCFGGEHEWADKTVESRVLRTLLAGGKVSTDEWDGFDLGKLPEAGQESPFLTYSQLAELPPPSWLIEEVVPQGSLGYITGRDGTLKTFVALDMALSLICVHSAWHGDRQIKATGGHKALFLAGEGVRSFGKRIDAWREHHGYIPGDDGWDEFAEFSDDLIIRNGTVDLYAGEDAYQQLLKHVRATKPDLIVVDTLARSAGAAEQNSASDMSVITARLAGLKQASGDHCTVIVIAHTTKADTDARGSSSIEDDADFVLHCKKSGMDLTINVAKMKDGESGQDIQLRARSVAESLVLDEPTELDEIDSGHTPRSRILAAVRTILVGSTYATTATIGKHLEHDITGLGEMKYPTLARWITSMEEEGLLVKTTRGAKQSVEITLNPQHPDAMLDLIQ